MTETKTTRDGIETDRERMAAPAKRRASILVVDDDVMILRMVCRMLDRQHEVRVVEDGDEALALLGGERPDIVLCDFDMPGQSGMEVHEQACALDPVLGERFIFMSGDPFSDRFRAFAARFARRLLVKPFSGEQLARLLDARLATTRGKDISDRRER